MQRALPPHMTPFTRMVNLRDGTIPDAVLVQTRRLSDLQGLFADCDGEQALLADNPIIYEVYEATDNPDTVGQLRYSTTVIHPGKVGREYFMTKGHYHSQGECSELYFGLLGEGYLLLQTPEGQVSTLRMTPGTAAYVPPFWGHRTLNVGHENFVFFAVYPAQAGYDYHTIEEQGFAAIMIENNGQPELAPKVHFRKP